jgi:hypothetical protein
VRDRQPRHRYRHHLMPLVMANALRLAKFGA